MEKVVLLILLACLSLTVSANSCEKISVEKLISNAEYIYAGKVIKTKLDLEKGVETSFKVFEVFKGNVKKYELVTNIDNVFPIEFLVGHSYVVLANKNNQVSSCTGYDHYYALKGETHSNSTGILQSLRESNE